VDTTQFGEAVPPNVAAVTACAVPSAHLMISHKWKTWNEIKS